MAFRNIVFSLVALVAINLPMQAQNVEYARSVIDTLCAPEMHGRGYVKEGHLRAAKYLSREFDRIGLQPLDNSFFQDFHFSVNTFPGAVELSVNGEPLTLGEDFIVHAPSGSLSGSFDALMVKRGSFVKKKKLAQLEHADLSNTVIIADNRKVHEEEKEPFEAMPYNPLRAKAVILVQDKLTASFSENVFPHAVIDVHRDALPKKIKTVEVNVENARLDVIGKNVIGYVPGTEYPDSFLVITAHYDHLGRMGADVYFPGANDNASGTAMLLSLAKHFVANPHKLSVAFIATGAEEVGLIGSRNFTQYPLFPLEKIGFLLNFDILGTGDEGIKVVNATEFTEEFERLEAINIEKQYLPAVKRRGKAAISDHYFFTEKGVRCFYWYTLGGIDAYHDVFDRPETLPLTEFDDLFRLTVEFLDTF